MNSLQESSAGDRASHLSRCVLRDSEKGVWLYQADCIEFMDEMFEKCADGKFDMIFADPPYFLSNGGITCHAGKMVSVDKGKWDKSGGVDANHEFNRSWISRCQKLLKPNGTLWVSETHHVIHSVGYAMQQLGMKILNNIKHPTQKPVSLLERIILASTDKDDLIFDPFSGSSTTGVAAIKTHRKFVGTELEQEFVELSTVRLQNAIAASRLSLKLV